MVLIEHAPTEPLLPPRLGDDVAACSTSDITLDRTELSNLLDTDWVLSEDQARLR